MAHYAIEALVQTRSYELGMSYSDVIKAAGYANVTKGLRKLYEMFEGNTGKVYNMLIQNLPDALQVAPGVVQEAIERTRQQRHEEYEAEMRATFEPHARFLTEQNGRPRQITMAGLIGAGRFLKLKFPSDLSPENYYQFVMEALPTALRPVRVVFYPPTGFVINWTFERASRYDLDGNHIEDLPRAYFGGSIEIRV